jgi:hypothetical protein
MSTRGSGAPNEAEAIRRAVAAERAQAPVAIDPHAAALRNARIGTPVLVYAPEGEPAFWLVPLIVGRAACGFARVELNRRVSQLAMFGGHADDRRSWPAAAFFKQPPDAMLAEIRARYPDARLSEPMLSYDGSPARWAWRVDVADGGSATVFITPGGWYERNPSPGEPNREG